MCGFMTWYKHNFLRSDVVGSAFTVALASGLALFFVGADHLTHLFDGLRAALYGTASAGCAALLGFIITVATITDAIMQSAQWEAFRKSRAYAEVQDIYFSTIRWLGVGTLVFVVLLIVDTDNHPQLWCEILAAWIVSVLALRLRRSIDALEKLLRMNSLKMKS